MRVKRRGSNPVPALVLVPAAVAPLVLVGGWNLAASAQTDDYSGFRDSLSELAAYGSAHRGIMTGAFIILGVAHVLTALLLRAAAGRGRVIHAVGGLAVIGVGLRPLSSETEGTGHAILAIVAFVALALWPAFGARRDGPPVLRPVAMRTASAVLGLLVVWFGVALAVDQLAGLAERVAALAEALWPLVVAWMVREWDGGGGTPPEQPPSDSPAPDDERPQDWRPFPVDHPVGSRR